MSQIKKTGNGLVYRTVQLPDAVLVKNVNRFTNLGFEILQGKYEGIMFAFGEVSFKKAEKEGDYYTNYKWKILTPEKEYLFNDEEFGKCVIEILHDVIVTTSTEELINGFSTNV